MTQPPLPEELWSLVSGPNKIVSVAFVLYLAVFFLLFLTAFLPFLYLAYGFVLFGILTLIPLSIRSFVAVIAGAVVAFAPLVFLVLTQTRVREPIRRGELSRATRNALRIGLISIFAGGPIPGILLIVARGELLRAEAARTLSLARARLEGAA